MLRQAARPCAALLLPLSLSRHAISDRLVARSIAATAAVVHHRSISFYSTSRPLSSAAGSQSSSSSGSATDASHSPSTLPLGARDPPASSDEQRRPPPPPQPRGFFRRFRSKFRSPLWRIVPWLPVAAFTTAHICSIGNVTGGSMSPTFNGPIEQATAANSRSDVVLLNRHAAAMRRFKVGDIVTLTSPLNPNELITKRIIALEGDVVRVWAPTDLNGGQGRWTRIKIPPGHVWIEGDAGVDIVPGSLGWAAGSDVAKGGPMGKRKSRDSRELGPIPSGLITARIDAILWPPSRFGRPADRPSPADAISVPSHSSNNRHQYPLSLPESSELTSHQFDEDERLRSIATQVHPSLARILDEMEARSASKRVLAHPQDSRLSPYVDWSEGGEQGGGETEEARARDASEVDDKRQAGMRRYWNAMSRGGTLGDDADSQRG